MSSNNWNLIGQEVIWEGLYRKMLRRRFKAPDGRVLDYDIKAEGTSVCCLAITVPPTNVVLVEQFRPGPNKVLIELPGGHCPDDEAPIDAAERELLEETGYQGEITVVGTSWNCAYSTRQTHTFVVSNAIQVSDPKPDPYEFIRVVLIPLNEFRQFIRRGELTDSKSAYLALDKLNLL